MIEPAQITSASVHESIMARHNEQMQDCNPDFWKHEITQQGRECFVTFSYGYDEKGFHTKFDGRKWS